MQCMAGKVFMTVAAKLNFHQKAVAKEGGRREDIAGRCSARLRFSMGSLLQVTGHVTRG